MAKGFMYLVAISMDGKGRWVDNVFIERLWRSVKYEDVYLRAYGTRRELRDGLRRYFKSYNCRRVQIRGSISQLLD